MTNALVKEGSGWPWFLYSSLQSMGFGIESPPILFLLMVFGLWLLGRKHFRFQCGWEKNFNFIQGFYKPRICQGLQDLTKLTSKHTMKERNIAKG